MAKLVVQAVVFNIVPLAMFLSEGAMFIHRGKVEVARQLEKKKALGNG